MRYFKKLVAFLLILQLTSCSKDEETDVYRINYSAVETINAIVVDTQAGWTLLSETYGFIELMKPLHDSLKIDALKVKVTIHRGRTYFDNSFNTLDGKTWERDFTFAEIIGVQSNEILYDGPGPPVIEIFWSPDYPDETISYPDGYGYFVQASENGFKIGQPSFPAIEGFGTFKTEVEAYKVGAHVMHRMLVLEELPDTGRPELDFLKIDWYIPD